MFGLLGALVSITGALAAPAVEPPSADPCAAISGKTFVDPALAIACQKSFPFNETLRQNVMSVVSNVFDFYTFEDFYINSPHPFEESTVNIREVIQNLTTQQFATDFDFNIALYNFTTKLNDGHTRWFPDCYNSYQNILPAPVTILEENGESGVYVVPDSNEFLSLLGPEFIKYYEDLKFDWKRLAGAKISEIEGMNAFDYIDHIATELSGNFLDHGIRVNSVLSSYRINNNSFSQRLGDLAGPSILTQTSLSMTLTTANSTTPETVNIPFVANLVGKPFTDRDSYWKNNCAADKKTNGVDNSKNTTTSTSSRLVPASPSKVRRKMAVLKDVGHSGVALPNEYIPTLQSTDGSESVIKSYVLPSNKTGVMFVGSFEPDDFDGFQTDVHKAITDLKKAGVEQLIIDLSDNGGGYVCLGLFLHRYLAGSSIGNPGFQSTIRAGDLARKIVRNDIQRGINNSNAFYAPDNWAFLNDTIMPNSNNYIEPPVDYLVNNQTDMISQRLFDVCTPYSTDVPDQPPFDLSKVAIVGNGFCASTCALFSTVMYERHGTKFAIFGGKPGEPIQIKGMAGNEVLEWSDLDSEIKTAGLTSDSLAPPDLLVSGNMRVNWRTAWSWTDPSTPIAYVDQPAQMRFPYTKDTYNNPQNLWIFAEQQFFGNQ